jgi:hypothetical protein
VVLRRAGRLYHEDVGAAHVILDAHLRLAVGELADLRLGELGAGGDRDGLRKRRVRAAGYDP